MVPQPIDYVFVWLNTLTIKDITDQHVSELLQPHYPFVFNRTLEFIDIDFITNDDTQAEANFIDYFELFDERLKKEIPNWVKLKALKKSLQRKDEN